MNLCTEGKMEIQTANEVIRQLKAMFFGDRTLSMLSRILNEQTSLDTGKVIDKFDQYRIKKIDLESFLETKRWEHN